MNWGTSVIAAILILIAVGFVVGYVIEFVEWIRKAKIEAKPPKDLHGDIPRKEKTFAERLADQAEIVKKAKMAEQERLTAERAEVLFPILLEQIEERAKLGQRFINIEEKVKGTEDHVSSYITLFKPKLEELGFRIRRVHNYSTNESIFW